MQQRVIVFIDNQNVYHGARRALFGEGIGKNQKKAPFSEAEARIDLFKESTSEESELRRNSKRWLHTRYGNIWPHEVGELACQLLSGHSKTSSSSSIGQDLKLEQVRVYYGMPSPERNPRMAMSTRQRAELWHQQDARVTLHPHNLLYRNTPDGKVQIREKGVDVALAVDFIDLAHKRAYDIGLIFSSDTDFAPALQKAHDIGCIAGELQWISDAFRTRIDRTETAPCIWFTAESYQAVCAHARP